jgi:hypothetical protein
MRALLLKSYTELELVEMPRPGIAPDAEAAEGPNWFQRLYSKEPELMKVILKP